MREMIGARVGAAKVVEDPRPKTSTPKDVKTDMGARPKEKKPLSKNEREIINVEETESKNEGGESEKKVVEKIKEAETKK